MRGGLLLVAALVIGAAPLAAPSRAEAVARARANNLEGLDPEVAKKLYWALTEDMSSILINSPKGKAAIAQIRKAGVDMANEQVVANGRGAAKLLLAMIVADQAAETPPAKLAAKMGSKQLTRYSIALTWLAMRYLEGAIKGPTLKSAREACMDELSDRSNSNERSVPVALLSATMPELDKLQAAKPDRQRLITAVLWILQDDDDTDPASLAFGLALAHASAAGTIRGCLDGLGEEWVRQ